MSRASKRTKLCYIEILKYSFSKKKKKNLKKKFFFDSIEKYRHLKFLFHIKILIIVPC